MTLARSKNDLTRNQEREPMAPVFDAIYLSVFSKCMGTGWSPSAKSEIIISTLVTVPPGLRCDLILSNPPYIPTSELASLQPEVRDHDPALALDGGPDGLAFYRRLAVDAPRFLTADGRLMVEFGEDQSAVLDEIFRRQNWIVERIAPDYAGRPRLLIAHRPPPGKPA